MAPEPRDASAGIGLLGGFRVVVGGREIAPEAWPGRRSAELVQLLALADGHRLVRDQVIEALWPHLDAEAGSANLRKAAHHARQALGDNEAVVLRGGQVALFPSRSTETDVERFEARADDALGGDDPLACAAAASLYRGDLLPESLYADWAQAPRQHLRSRRVELLRRGGQWERLVEVEPTDEPAYQELMRSALATGSRPAAIRWYGRLRTALGRELGVLPSRDSEAVYDECVAGLGAAEPAFVGRQVELARATAVLRSEPGAEVGVLVVRGAAGIGKSTLCQQVATVGRHEGWTVVTVAATQASSPYTPLAAAVEQLVGRDRALLDAVGARARTVLAELTSLAAPATPLDGALTRHQVIGALRRLLLAGSGAGGVVLVIDDAHVADEATIDVVLHLGGPAGTPLLVVLAYRQEAAPAALSRGVARLARGGRVVEIELGPLDRAEATALVAVGAPTAPGPGVVDQIVDLGQGNPFFTLELARSAASGAPLAIAPTVWDAISARFVDLDEGATAMLERLALASDDLDPAGVVALTGSSEEEAFALLDVALAAGILVVSGARYRFRHELVRQALVEQFPPHQRIAVHRDAARRLATQGAPPAQIAGHWLDGGRPHEAVDWLLAAARQAVKLGAFADALGHLEPLLAHVPDYGDALSLRAETLDALGDSGAPAAYAAAARAVGEAAAHEIRAKRALAQLKLGDPGGALQMLVGVEPVTVEGRLAQALTLCSAAALGFADPELGRAKAAECRRLALESGDAAAVTVASWAQGAAAHARGDLSSSLRFDLRETRALPELAISVFDGQLCVTQGLLYGARPYPEVVSFADSFAAEAERLGAARGHAFAVTIRGEAKLLAGQLDAADDDLERGARLHRALAAATGEALALQRRAEVALHRGRPADVDALLDEALAVSRESNVGFHLLDRVYGTRITAAPDAASSLAALEEAEAAVRGPVETCPGCRITLAVPAAIAAARAGDLDRATHYAEATEMLATVVMCLPAWYAALDEVKGHLARATGDAVAAGEHFHKAAALFRRAGQPLDEARCAALEAGRA
ncbi:MAG: AAA family ATPase [Acidimicrobiia bacterium]|nr:AAA family ATPase [Acidimicrobiia bacterium]